MLSNASEMGDNVLKACPSIQWSPIQWVHPALVGSNPNHTIYAFSVYRQIVSYLSLYCEKDEYKRKMPLIGLKTYINTFFNGPFPACFLFIFVFSNKHYNFYNKKLCRDTNP